jgi:hypothetical protein
MDRTTGLGGSRIGVGRYPRMLIVVNHQKEIAFVRTFITRELLEEKPEIWVWTWEDRDKTPP